MQCSPRLLQRGGTRWLAERIGIDPRYTPHDAQTIAGGTVARAELIADAARPVFNRTLIEGIGRGVSHPGARIERMTDPRPQTDGRPPAEVVAGMVEAVLHLVDTWPAWDGRPRPVDDRVYTPHKAVRRVADHMIDHLAEVEARLAGQPTIPDRWHASAITTSADLAPFTEADCEEAHSRLERLAQIWRVRLGALDDQTLDRSDGDAWTIREVAFHLAESVYYAEAVGDLSADRPRS